MVGGEQETFFHLTFTHLADKKKSLLKTIKMGKCTWILLLTHILRAWGQMIELSPTPCNDKAVEKLSKLALTYINEDRTEGYKFALNRISNVHLHAQVSFLSV